MKKNIFLMLTTIVTSALLSGCTEKIPECSDEIVKNKITTHLSNVLYDLQIPDLTESIGKNKVLITLDQIKETKKNKESKFVQCSASITVIFPKDDFAKAKQIKSIIKIVPNDSVFTSNVSYSVAVPSDEKDKKNGPIVEIIQKSLTNFDKNITPYLNTYDLLAQSVLDINIENKNTKKWNKDFKTAVVDECTEIPYLDNSICKCVSDKFENVSNEYDFRRITYNIGRRPMLGKMYPNYTEYWSNSIKECQNK